MKPIIILLFTLTIYFPARAHMVETYTTSKNGITISCVIGLGSKEEKKLLDAFLRRLVSRLERRDKNIDILISSGHLPVFYFSKNWFATIAFDTLAIPDYKYIDDYFKYRLHSAFREQILKGTRPSDKYKTDLPQPLDLNASYHSGARPVGLKIMYDYATEDSTFYWDRLYTLAQYAIDHIEEIKKDQQRLRFIYNLSDNDIDEYNPTVSLLTIDTAKIRNIPLLQLGFDDKNVNTDTDRSWVIWAGAGLAVLISLLLVLKRKQPGRNNQP